MANRNFTQFQYSLVKGVVNLWARVSIGATGAPTLSKWNPASRAYTAAPTTGTGPYAVGCEGVKSVTRNSTGVYSFVLQDSYQRLLAVNCIQANTTGLPTAVLVGLWAATDVTSATAPTIKLTTMSSSATAADPANGDVLLFNFILQNSAVI